MRDRSHSGFLRAAVGMAFCLATAPVAAAPACALTTAAHDDRSASCAKIAELLVPRDIMMAQAEAVADGATTATFAKNPQLVGLDVKYPGLQQAVVIALRSQMRDISEQLLPLYRADIAALYAANLTPVEARAYLQFLSTPEMHSFNKVAGVSGNSSGLAKTMVDTGNFHATDTEINSANASGLRAAINAMSLHQRTVIIQFLVTPTGKKVTALAPQKLAIQTKWVNYSTPELQKRVQEATVLAMIDFIAKTDPATADGIRATWQAREARPN